MSLVEVIRVRITASFFCKGIRHNLPCLSNMRVLGFISFGSVGHVIPFVGFFVTLFASSPFDI